MKKRPALFLLLGTLILLGGGCGSGEEETATNPPPAPVPGQTPAVPAPSAPQAAVPTPEVNSAPVNFASFGLIPSTNVKQRQQEITAGRTNPFSLIPIQATIPAPIPAPIPLQTDSPKDGVTKNTSGSNASKVASNNSKASKSPLVTKKPLAVMVSKSRLSACNALKASSSGKLSKSSQSKSDLLACDRLDSSDPMLSLPVPLPNPSEAKAVAVLGVLQIGNKPFAIVQAPGESVPRYITTGSSLVNGEVMVKSINSFTDNPTVTLVQYNQEVVRAVGEPSEQPADAKPEALPENNQTSYLSRESGELERLSFNP